MNNIKLMKSEKKTSQPHPKSGVPCVVSFVKMMGGKHMSPGMKSSQPSALFSDGSNAPTHVNLQHSFSPISCV